MSGEKTKLKHTPGPWKAHDNDGTGTLPCVLSEKINAGGNWYVAQCHVYEDALLVAAAPELLAAIEELVHSLEWEEKRSGTTYFGFEAAKAAIEKAKGVTK
jgi:hypothetical protein